MASAPILSRGLSLSNIGCNIGCNTGTNTGTYTGINPGVTFRP